MAQGGAKPTPDFATPSVVLGTAAAAGSSASTIRSDSTIVAFDATVPVTQAFGDAAATGSAAFAAHRDHKHAMPSDPNAVTTAVHGLPASVAPLGNRNAVGEFIQRGTDNPTTTATSTTALSFFREHAVTFPVAFSGTPIICIGSTSGFPVGVTVVSTTGFTVRQWDNQGTGSLPWSSAYIAVGT